MILTHSLTCPAQEKQESLGPCVLVSRSCVIPTGAYVLGRGEEKKATEDC